MPPFSKSLKVACFVYVSHFLNFNFIEVAPYYWACRKYVRRYAESISKLFYSYSSPRLINWLVITDSNCYTPIAVVSTNKMIDKAKAPAITAQGNTFNKYLRDHTYDVFQRNNMRQSTK